MSRESLSGSTIDEALQPHSGTLREDLLGRHVLEYLLITCPIELLIFYKDQGPGALMLLIGKILASTVGSGRGRSMSHLRRSRMGALVLGCQGLREF